jgi:DNA-binding response OmpR family regulator
MSKVIEVDFLPKETDAAFSWLDSIGDSARRILIVDNDRNSTHLVKVLLEKTGRYLVLVTRAEASTGLRIDEHPFLAKPIDIQELIKAIEAHVPARAKSVG